MVNIRHLRKWIGAVYTGKSADCLFVSGKCILSTLYNLHRCLIHFGHQHILMKLMKFIYSGNYRTRYNLPLFKRSSCTARSCEGSGAFVVKEFVVRMPLKMGARNYTDILSIFLLACKIRFASSAQQIF